MSQPHAQVRSKLREAVLQLAEGLAEGVLEAIRNVSLEDLLAEAAGHHGVQTPVKRGPGRPRKVAALASAPRLEEAAAEPRAGKRTSNRRLGRRTPADIAQVIERLVALLNHSPEGLRSEEIQTKLGLVSKELPRPIMEALAARRISKQGQKRATRYFAAGKASGPAKAAKGATKTKTASKLVAKVAPKAAAAAKASSSPKLGKKAGKKAGSAKSSGSKSTANGAHGASSAAISS